MDQSAVHILMHTCKLLQRLAGHTMTNEVVNTLLNPVAPWAESGTQES